MGHNAVAASPFQFDGLSRIYGCESFMFDVEKMRNGKLQYFGPKTFKFQHVCQITLY